MPRAWSSVWASRSPATSSSAVVVGQKPLDERQRTLLEGADRAAVGVALDAPAGRVEAVGVDARRARAPPLLTQAVWPSRLSR